MPFGSVVSSIFGILISGSFGNVRSFHEAGGATVGVAVADFVDGVAVTGRGWSALEGVWATARDTAANSRPVRRRLLFTGRSFGGAVGERHRSVFGNQILAGHALHIGGGDFLDVVNAGEQFAPIAVVGVIGGEQRGESGIAVELLDQAGARLGLGAFERGLIDQSVLELRENGVELLLIFFRRMTPAGNQVEEEQIRILAAGHGRGGASFERKALVADEIRINDAGAAAGKNVGDHVEDRIVFILL